MIADDGSHTGEGAMGTCVAGGSRIATDSPEELAAWPAGREVDELCNRLVGC